MKIQDIVEYAPLNIFFNWFVKKSNPSDRAYKYGLRTIKMVGSLKIAKIQKNLNSNIEPYVITQSIQLSKRTADVFDNLNLQAQEFFFVNLPIYVQLIWILKKYYLLTFYKKKKCKRAFVSDLSGGDTMYIVPSVKSTHIFLCIN